MIGHFNTDELAGYRAGTVSDGKAARIGAHLSACPRCADVDSGLADVSQLLAGIPVPPMPERLTLRLQAAIAEEAAQRAAATPPLGEAGWSAVRDRSPALIPGRPDLPRRARRPVRRPGSGIWAAPLLLRGLAAAGALVLLVGGGILLANQRDIGPSASRVAAPGAARPTRSRLGASAALGSVSAIKLRYQHGGQTAYTNVVTSYVNYTKTDLAAGVRREAAHAAQLSVPSVVQPPSSPQPQAQHVLDDTTVGQLESCLSTLAAGRLVELVEIARYLSRPVTIIIFEPVNHAYEVIVVSAACGAVRQDIITSLVVPEK